MESCGGAVASGEMESGMWKVSARPSGENGELKIESGEMRWKKLIAFTHNCRLG